MSYLLCNEARLTRVYPAPIMLAPPKAPAKSQPPGVPKIVWRTWKDETWKTECVSAFLHSKRVLPDWQHIVWTDKECRAFIKSEFDPRILDAYDVLNYGVMRADLWRYLVVYFFGGLYVDMKTTITREPAFRMSVADVPRVYTSPWDVQHLPSYYHGHLFAAGELQQFWIAAEPRAPALWSIICQVVANILALQKANRLPDFVFLPKRDSSKSRVLSTTGPIVYTHVLAKYKQQNKQSVIILPSNCNACIQYNPPDDRELPRYRTDHYSKQTKPLLKIK